MLRWSGTDKPAIALLGLGLGLAVAAAVLPSIDWAAPQGGITMLAWDVLSWFARLKFIALGLLFAAALRPGLRRGRLLTAGLAVVMVVLPAVGSFLSELHAWGAVPPDRTPPPGQPSPHVHPGIAKLAFVLAAVLVSYAVWRIETRAGPPGQKPSLADA